MKLVIPRNMKSFFRKNVTFILIGLIVVFVCLTVVGYFYPDSVIGGLITYYSGISSLVIVLLTLMYVIVTNRQLLTMQKQLNIMDSSIKLQIQPLPVPSIKDIRLDKIRAYRGPETHFSKVEIFSKFYFNIDFKNAGTGAALNIAVFASILVEGKNKEKKEIEIPQIKPNQIHLICEKESQTGDFGNLFMIIDKQFEIFRALVADDEPILKLRIYYKNIFGSGFLEEAQYFLTFSSNQDDVARSWEEFIDDGIKSLSQDIIRFESLISSLPGEAKESLAVIRKHLEERFDKDIELTYRINPSSFNVRIVNFDEALKTESSHYKDLLKSYDPSTYKMLEDYRSALTKNS